MSSDNDNIVLLRTQSTFTQSADGTKTYTYVYVYSHDTTTTVVDIMTSNSVPQMEDVLDIDNDVWVQSRDAAVTDGGEKTIITITYSNAQDSSDSSGTTVPPEPPSVSHPLYQWGTTTNEVEISRYIDNVDSNIIVNTAKQPITGLMGYKSHATLSVTIQYPSKSLAGIVARTGKINSDRVVIDGVTIEIGEALFLGYDIQSVWIDNVEKFNITYKFEFAERINLRDVYYSAYDAPVASTGTQYIHPDTGLLVDITTANNTQNQGFLDNSGNWVDLTGETPGQPDSEDDIAFLTRPKVGRISFASTFSFATGA